jgi:hypothetical protein
MADFLAGFARFFVIQYTKAGKIYKLITKLQNAHKIYPMVAEYYKWQEYITAFSIPRSCKIYPNWDFWSEKKPSGNPALWPPFLT